MSESESGSGALVMSTNVGRYAVADAQYGPDLTGGTRIEVEVAGRWLGGIVEHSSSVEVGYYAISQGAHSLPGYGYFVLLDAGGVIGLCTGMRVRLERKTT